MHRIDQFVSPPRRPQVFVLISGGSEQDRDLFLAALYVRLLSSIESIYVAGMLWQ
jgi:hypothetical protein